MGIVRISWDVRTAGIIVAPWCRMLSEIFPIEPRVETVAKGQSSWHDFAIASFNGKNSVRITWYGAFPTHSSPRKTQRRRRRQAIGTSCLSRYFFVTRLQRIWEKRSVERVMCSQLSVRICTSIILGIMHVLRYVGTRAHFNANYLTIIRHFPICYFFIIDDDESGYSLLLRKEMECKYIFSSMYGYLHR